MSRAKAHNTWLNAYYAVVERYLPCGSDVNSQVKVRLFDNYLTEYDINKITEIITAPRNYKFLKTKPDKTIKKKLNKEFFIRLNKLCLKFLEESEHDSSYATPGEMLALLHQLDFQIATLRRKKWLFWNEYKQLYDVALNQEDVPANIIKNIPNNEMLRREFGSKYIIRGSGLLARLDEATFNFFMDEILFHLHEKFGKAVVLDISDSIFLKNKNQYLFINFDKFISPEVAMAAFTLDTKLRKSIIKIAEEKLKIGLGRPADPAYLRFSIHVALLLKEIGVPLSSADGKPNVTLRRNSKNREKEIRDGGIFKQTINYLFSILNSDNRLRESSLLKIINSIS